MAGWRGHGWAISLLAFAFGLGIVVTLIAILTAGTACSPLLVTSLSAIGLAYTAALLGLLYSPSLNAFFRHQQQHRTPPNRADAQASSRRDIVQLTPAAAELFRKTVKDRGYPADTTLRVVVGNGDQPPFDVRYDVPAVDDRDWICESSGAIILVDKQLDNQLRGLTVDANGGRFVFVVEEVQLRAADGHEPPSERSGKDVDR